MKANKNHLLSILFLILGVLVSNAQTLPTASNDWFTGSGVCLTCHNSSSFALTDNQGNDVAPVMQWRSTMLANASKDPFWKAKVKHEGIENPAHKNALENTCTRCHAPMGMINAFLNVSGDYTLDILRSDNLGKDGISCTLCHQINNFSSPLFSGNFEINSAKEIYGPYVSPLTQQMVMNSGFTPTYSEKINDSRLCGTCHTLLTNSVDENGEFTGETFVEQAIYQEWENSDFGQQNISCQSCHMPRINDAVKISSRPSFVAARSPFGMHTFTGGNAFMLNLLKNNHDELALNSTTELIDQSIGRTKEFLMQHTISMTLEEVEPNSDSLFFQVTLENLAGHKFPTAYPSRRAFLEFEVVSGGETVFHSGEWEKGALAPDAEEFESHHEIITNDNQVQIYEFVMGNTENEVTTILERAYLPLKDNRIVPRGFSSSHSSYDTVKVVGKALEDLDYSSGLGKEQIVYKIPARIVNNESKVKVSLFYEPVPEKWLLELFDEADKDEDIQLFEKMYHESDQEPILIAADSTNITATSISNKFKKNSILVYPNPSSGMVTIDGISGETNYTVFTSGGILVENGVLNVQSQEIDLRLPAGNYLFITRSSKDIQVNKLILK